MLVKNILNSFNLLLSLGAFYLGFSMISGIYDTFPQEWIGKIPFNSWSSLALFGMIVFGIGNGIAAIYGFIMKDKVFIMTFTMGVVFFFTTVISTKLVGEWYLITSQFLLVSIIQISLGLFGFVIEFIKGKKR